METLITKPPHGGDRKSEDRDQKSGPVVLTAKQTKQVAGGLAHLFSKPDMPPKN